MNNGFNIGQGSPFKRKPLMMGFETDKRICKKYGNIPTTAEVGGKTYNFRAKAEIKLARYLQLLKMCNQIKDWEYESQNFVFKEAEGSWLIDFTVRNNDDSFEFYEYKGRVEPDTKWKLYMLNKINPNAKVTMVFGNTKQLKRLGVRATACCKRVCLLSELTKGII